MFSRLTIKTKMMISLCGVILLMYGITIFFVMNSANSIIKEEAIDKTDYLASYYSNIIKKEVDHAMQTAQTIAQTYEGLIAAQKEPDQTSLNAVLKKIMERNQNFSGLWVMLDPGFFFQYPYSPYFYRENGKISSKIVVDIEHYTKQKSEVYYTLPKQQAKEVLLEPYKDADLHIMMTTTAVPIIANGEFAGVVGIDFSLEALTTIISQIKPYDTGMATLISNSGKYIAHPDSSMNNQGLGAETWLPGDVASAISKGEKYSIHGNAKGLNDSTYRIFVPVQIADSEASWSFSVEVPMKKVLQRGRKIMWVCLITGMIAILTAGCVIFLIAIFITRAITLTAAGLKDVAQGEGDLTMRLPISSKDELGELASWFNVFMGKMQDIIIRISKDTNEVDRASRSLSGIAAELSSQADKSSDRANNVAAATEELNASITTVAAAMEQSSTNSSMVASASEEMSATISQIAGNVEEASKISDSAVQQAQETAKRMGELETAAQTISRVTETITEISEKTHLLALNATIEAARAGEAGKGFAVVATEIKELANQTAEATNDIKKQISGIQCSSKISISAMDGIVDIINQINEIISTITTAVGEQSTTTQEITANITHTSQGLMEINANVSQGASISGEISRDITQVSEAAGQIAGKSSDVTLQADQLQKLSAELKEIVNSFKI